LQKQAKDIFAVAAQNQAELIYKPESKINKFLAICLVNNP